VEVEMTPVRASVAVLLTALAPVLAGAEPPGWTVREVPLGPTGTLLDVSPDLTRVARLVKRGGKSRVLVDADEVSADEDVLFFSFSPDSKRYALVRKRDGRLRLVVDGAETWDWKGGGFFASVSSGFWFCPSGARWFLMTGRVGFAISQFQRPGKYALVVDGKAVADDLDSVFVSSEDGRRIGYIARRPDASGKQVPTLVMLGADGEQAQHSDVQSSCEACDFSPAGQRLAYAVRRNDGWALVLDGVESGVYEEIKAVSFSADGKRVAYPGRRLAGWLAVVDGHEGKGYEELGEGRDALGRSRAILFSPDGKRVGYSARRRGAWVMVLDGVEGAEYQEVGGPVFSPDGKHVAYRAKQAGKWLVVANGAPGKPYDEIKGLFFSDSGRLVYRARAAGKWILAEEGRDGTSFEEIAVPAFSPGGARVAHAAKRDGKWRLVVDGMEGPEYEFLGERRLVFDGPRALRTLVKRNQELARLEVELPE
jgi:WD40-like Beta Propeller Repeat